VTDLLLKTPPEKLPNLRNIELSGLQFTMDSARSVRAWSHTRWGLLFKVLRWPLIGPLADAAYRYWARKRYQRYP